MKFWTSCIIAFVVGFFIGAAPQQCKAQTVGLHLGSIHVPQREQNNFNPGLYFETESKWIAGFYRNSFKRPSVYFGKSFETDVGPLKAGFTVGAISGYDKRDSQHCEEVEYWGRKYLKCKTVTTGFADHKIIPFGAPYVKYGFAKLIVIPSLEKERSTVFHLAIEKKFEGI